REIACRAFRALGLEGLARGDMFVTTDHRVLVNEVNTMPGFTPYSMFPVLWENMGLSYADLISELIEQARRSHLGTRGALLRVTGADAAIRGLDVPADQLGEVQGRARGLGRRGRARHRHVDRRLSAVGGVQEHVVLELLDDPVDLHPAAVGERGA